MVLGNANASSRLYPPLRGRPASPDGFGIGVLSLALWSSSVADVSDDESAESVDANVIRLLRLISTKFIRGVMIGTEAGRIGKNCMRGVISGRCRCMMCFVAPQPRELYICVDDNTDCCRSRQDSGGKCTTIDLLLLIYTIKLSSI